MSLQAFAEKQLLPSTKCLIHIDRATATSSNSGGKCRTWAATTYRYDSSLDQALSWDESSNRDLAEWLMELAQRYGDEGESAVFGQLQAWAGGGVQVQSLKTAADLLQVLSKPFMSWAGKAERHQIYRNDSK